jgi:hypothetical protein
LLIAQYGSSRPKRTATIPKITRVPLLKPP